VEERLTERLLTSWNEVRAHADREHLSLREAATDMVWHVWLTPRTARLYP